MGIDLRRYGRIKNRSRGVLRARNIYLKLLIKLYKFLARRTSSKFNKLVLRRLHNSNNNKFPIGLSRLVKLSQQTGSKGKIQVVIGTVTNDIRLLNVPKLTVCALHFTETARKRILKAGGQVLTLDQLAKIAPTGTGTVLLRGPREREAFRFFGPPPGAKGSHTAPRVLQRGRKVETALGRR